jgi:hypothetical protein
MAAGFVFNGRPANYGRIAYCVFKKPPVRAYFLERQEEGNLLR